MKPTPTYTILERPLNTAQAAKFAGCSASTIRKAREMRGEWVKARQHLDNRMQRKRPPKTDDRQ